jgi:hypothetical protein
MTKLAVVPLSGLIGTGPASPSRRPDTDETQTVNTPSRIITFHDFNCGDHKFRIFLMHGHRLTDGAKSLLERAYTQLGYKCEHFLNGSYTSANVQACVDDRVVGTLSVNLDSPRGIQAESLYKQEIADFRRRGKICEFTRLAVAPDIKGREVLCSLFYVAYVYAHIIRCATDLFIEVNPRHTSFYKRMLAFQQRGEIRYCPRVGAPAVLLHLDFRYTAWQIERARSGLCVETSGLYKHAVVADEEQLLISRIVDDAKRH